MLIGNRTGRIAMIVAFVLTFQLHTLSVYAVDATGDFDGYVTVNENARVKVTLSGGNADAVNSLGEHTFYNGENVSFDVSVAAIGADLPAGADIFIQLPQDFEVTDNPDQVTNDVFFLNKNSEDFISFETDSVIPGGSVRTYMFEGFNIYIEEGVSNGFQPVTFEARVGQDAARCSTRIYTLPHAKGLVPQKVTVSFPVSTLGEFNVSYASGGNLIAKGDMIQVWFPVSGNMPFRTIDAPTGADVIGMVSGEPRSVGSVSYGMIENSYVYANIVFDEVLPDETFSEGAASFALRVDIANGNNGTPGEVPYYIPGQKFEEAAIVSEDTAGAAPVLAAPADTRAAEDAGESMADQPVERTEETENNEADGLEAGAGGEDNAAGTEAANDGDQAARNGTGSSGSGSRAASGGINARTNPKTQDSSGDVMSKAALCAAAVLVLGGLVAARRRVQRTKGLQ